MRTTVVVLALAVALVVGQVHSQRVFTDRAEFERQKAVYDMQKAKYDEFQALTKVPLLAGYDLITKGRDADQAPGKAEQLLPNYTGEKVKFQESGPTVVEPGNSARNYFHPGPIPAKKPKGASGNPLGSVGIPTMPGQDFILPADVPATPGPPETAPVPAPAPAVAAFAPVAPAPAFNAGGRGPATHALFFARGALPVAATAAFLQADAPATAPASARSFFATTRSIGVPSSAAVAGFPSPVPLRPLDRQTLFAPALPFSDFAPGPERSVAALQAAAPRPPIRPFPLYGLPGL